MRGSDQGSDPKRPGQSTFEHVGDEHHARAARGGAAGRRTPPEAACLLRSPEIASAMFAGGGGGELRATCEGRPSMHGDAHLVAPSRAISPISCHLHLFSRAARAHGWRRLRERDAAPLCSMAMFVCLFVLCVSSLLRKPVLGRVEI